MVVSGPHCPRQSREAVLLRFIEALIERGGGGSETPERVAARDERIRTALQAAQIVGFCLIALTLFTERPHLIGAGVCQIAICLIAQNAPGMRSCFQRLKDIINNRPS